MTIQFITDDVAVHTGFKAYFDRIPIDLNCFDWLNTTSLILASPEYPNMDCTWVITAPTPVGSTMSIIFTIFEVNMS